MHSDSVPVRGRRVSLKLESRLGFSIFQVNMQVCTYIVRRVGKKLVQLSVSQSRAQQQWKWKWRDSPPFTSLLLHCYRLLSIVCSLLLRNMEEEHDRDLCFKYLLSIENLNFLLGSLHDSYFCLTIYIHIHTYVWLFEDPMLKLLNRITNCDLPSPTQS